MKRLLWVLPILAIAAIATAQSTYHFAAPVMPVYASGGQPSGAASVGQIAIIGTNNAPWVDSNSGQWVSVQDFPNYRLEDYGAVPACSTTLCMTKNQTAWNNIQSAIGYGYGQAKGKVLIDAVFYMSGEIHLASGQIIQGVSPGTETAVSELIFPYTSRGIVFDYFSAGDPNGDAQGAQLNDIWITHQQGLPKWSATHSYANGAAVQPNYWGGLVMVNNGSTGTSGSTEPSWPENIQSPNAAATFSTVTDGSVTWTPTMVPLVVINALCRLRNVVVTAGYGDGIQIYSDTIHSIADGIGLDHVEVSNNKNAGVFVSGSDSQTGSFLDLVAIGNGTWGYLGKVNGYSNIIQGGQFSYNGANGGDLFSTNLAVGASGCCVVPPNDPSYTSFKGNQLGYAFSYSSGTTGASNLPAASWPTGPVGASVQWGTVLLTNAGKFYGGDVSSLSDNFTNIYSEEGNVKAYIGGTVEHSLLGSGVSIDSEGEVDNGNYRSPFYATNNYGGLGRASIADPNYQVSMSVGDVNGALFPQEWVLLDKAGSPLDKISVQYLNGNFSFIDSSYNYMLSFPLINYAPTGTTRVPDMLGGFFIGTPRGGGSAPGVYFTVANGGTKTQPQPKTTDVAGDIQYNGANSVLGTGESTEFIAVTTATGGGVGTYREKSWTAPAEGYRVDVLQSLPETDLQLIGDDLLVDSNLPSRVGSYTANSVGGIFLTAADAVGGGIANPTLVFYDASMRARSGLYGNSGGYYYLPSASAHMMPAGGKLTIEVQFWSNGTNAVTLMGGYSADLHNGWELSTNGSGALLFRAANTAAGYFVSMTSANSLVTGNKIHQVTVEWDSVDNYYVLLLDGVVVANTTSTTGTLGTTATQIAIGGLWTAGTGISNQAVYIEYQVERTLRLLSLYDEVPRRNAQVQTANSTSAPSLAVGPSNVSTTLKGYETEVFLTGPSMTVTLPPAGFEPSGYQVRFVDANGNAGATAQTIAPAGSDKINGANSSTTIGTNFGQKVVSDYAGQWYAQ